MKNYGQCIDRSPEASQEFDKFGGQIVGPRVMGTLDYGNPEYEWTEEEIRDWSTDPESEYDLVDWSKIYSGVDDATLDS